MKGKKEPRHEEMGGSQEEGKEAGSHVKEFKLHSVGNRKPRKECWASKVAQSDLLNNLLKNS